VRILKDLGVNIITDPASGFVREAMRLDSLRRVRAEAKKTAAKLPLSKCKCSQEKSTPKRMIRPEKRWPAHDKTEQSLLESFGAEEGVFAPEYFDGGNLAVQNREEKRPGALF